MNMAKKKPSKFLRVVCPRCRRIKIVFGKSCLRIKCEKCNKLLTESSGGKAKMKARVKEVLV